MITPEVRAEIRRLFFAEHWRVNTIAEELGVHHDTVESAIEKERFLVRPRPVRPTIVDPYKAFIEDTLKEHPRLRSTRIYAMVKDRGYTGSEIQIRRYVHKVRPQKKEAFFRLTTLPGEQAQVDWGSFGKISVGHAKRTLSCFVMVMSHSRAMFAHFFFDQTMESFLAGHVKAFDAFGGVPREILYDNLKTAVLQRKGDHVQFNPTLLELCGHYHFAPKPCAPYRGNEKGKVERTIQYLRHAFYAARHFDDIDDLNRQLAQWIETVAHQRPRPTDPDKTKVIDAFQHEKTHLLPLPENAFPCESVRPVKVGKTPYVRFDLNDYSVPHTFVKSTLTLISSPDSMRIVDAKGVVVAQHTRSYDKAQRIEKPEHIQALEEQKRHARNLRLRDRLEIFCPEMTTLLTRMAERNLSLGSEVRQLHGLLERYGQEPFCKAVESALAKHASSASSVGHILDQWARQSKMQPSIEVVLPDDERVRSLVVRAHDLNAYDAIGKTEDRDAS
ncbi:MAG: IS21 family transposase [Deltaproteobacteria bacterium]|nr:IS21 family transposase [Deltaproteobacteria bacterium]